MSEELAIDAKPMPIVPVVVRGSVHPAIATALERLDTLKDGFDRIPEAELTEDARYFVKYEAPGYLKAMQDKLAGILWRTK